MTAVSLTQPEILDRLRVHAAIGVRIADAKAKLCIEEQRIDDAIATLRAEAQRIAEEKAKKTAEEAAWSAQEIKLRTWLHELYEHGAIAPVPLEFASDGRTIRWENGAVKLGSTPCKFVKALYFAEGQQMTATNLEEKVWGEAEDATLQQTASNLRRTLAENNFPYTVVNRISREWQEPENLRINGQLVIPERPAIISFALVLT
jgi:hypothetical protein